jgi:hypothetical protein
LAAGGSREAAIPADATNAGPDVQSIERFRTHLASERRMSPHTVSNYLRDLAALRRWCSGQRIGHWQALDAQHIRQFAARSHASGLKPRSVQRRLSAVRTFLGFLVREGNCRTRSMPIKWGDCSRSIRKMIWSAAIWRSWNCFILPDCDWPNWWGSILAILISPIAPYV